MKEYELYVPLFSAAGKRIPNRELRDLKRRLIKRFGGLTAFPQKAKGAWKTGGTVFQDDILILRVLSTGSTRDREFLMGEKQEMKRRMSQDDVLIISRSVSRL